MVLASPTEIGTGFRTGTSRPVEGAACGDEKGWHHYLWEEIWAFFFLSVMILISDPPMEPVEAPISLMAHQGQSLRGLLNQSTSSPSATHLPRKYLPCSHPPRPVLKVSPSLCSET